jgi:hypothetical protein
MAKSIWVKGILAGMLSAVALTCTPAADAATCKQVTYHYKVGGAAFDAIFAGLSYHGGISTSAVGCASARRFVIRYGRAGFRHARSRNDCRPPDILAGYRCHRIRDGDDSGRDYCSRRGAHVFFSDSDGQFA